MPEFLGELSATPPTFAALVAMVSEHLGDIETGTLTTGSATAAADSTRNEPDGHWTGGLLSFTSGTAIGQEQRITGWTSAGGVFATNAFNPAPSVGDAYELRKEPNHQRAALKKFINEGVRDIQRADWVLIDSRTDLGNTTKFDQYTYEYTIPSQIQYLHKVLWQDPNATLNPPPAHPDFTWYPLLPSHWFINDYGTGTVIIEAHLAHIPDTAPLKFLGSRRPVEMVNETDPCEVDPNFVVLYAAMQMALRLSRGGTDADMWLRKAAILQQEMQRARMLARRALPPDARRVR